MALESGGRGLEGKQSRLHSWHKADGVVEPQSGMFTLPLTSLGQHSRVLSGQLSGRKGGEARSSPKVCPAVSHLSNASILTCQNLLATCYVHIWKSRWKDVQMPIAAV